MKSQFTSEYLIQPESERNGAQKFALGRSANSRSQLEYQSCRRLATPAARGSFTANWLVAHMKDAHETTYGRYPCVTGTHYPPSLRLETQNSLRHRPFQAQGDLP